MDDNINSRPTRFCAKFFTVVLLILIAAGVGAGIMYMIEVSKPKQANTTYNSEMQLGMSGVAVPSVGHLAEQFVDEDKDYVADPPKDPAKFIDPPKLVFSYVAQEEAEKYEAVWKPFCDHLSKVTGKPVEYLPVKTVEEQIKALADGNLVVTGLNTGAVPLAVNTCGFIPICRVPTIDPKGTHIEIIVPAASTISKPGDLKNHELTLTDPNSNSGYKAPMVLLKSDFSIKPEQDYVVRMSSGHEQSIEGIAKGEYQAAAVSADMLARAESAGTISKDKYRSIYRSESFPSAALGYVYNLKPELAAKVKEAIISFDFKGSPLETDLAGVSQTTFIPVTYKNDWALIRRIDEECARLREAK